MLCSQARGGLGQLFPQPSSPECIGEHRSGEFGD